MPDPKNKKVVDSIYKAEKKAFAKRKKNSYTKKEIKYYLKKYDSSFREKAEQKASGTYNKKEFSKGYDANREDRKNQSNKSYQRATQEGSRTAPLPSVAKITFPGNKARDAHRSKVGAYNREVSKQNEVGTVRSDGYGNYSYRGRSYRDKASADRAKNRAVESWKKRN